MEAPSIMAKNPLGFLDRMSRDFWVMSIRLGWSVNPFSTWGSFSISRSMYTFMVPVWNSPSRGLSLGAAFISLAVPTKV